MIDNHVGGRDGTTALTLRRALLSALLMFFAPAVTAWATDAPQPHDVHLLCDVGPVEKRFGTLPWLVFSCDDGHSMLIAAKRESPTAGAFFMFWWDGQNYQLKDMRKSHTPSTDAALAELSRLSPSEIDELLRVTLGKPL